MSHGRKGPNRARRLVVRVPVEPVEAVMEADAVDALRTESLAVRGPLFGIAAQSAQDGPRWRVVVPVTADNPQEARDTLNSRLWFRAKDRAEDRAERRALLAAVARLDRERVTELTVLGTRYRVVRAEEYAGMGDDGLELPRPTDPEPAVPDWSPAIPTARTDDGLVLDPDAPVTPAQAAERLALRRLSYSGTRFPRSVLDDSRRALGTHPDVLLMPVAFTVVERGREGWTPSSSLHPTAHDARRTLEFTLLQWRPRQRGLVKDVHADARTVLAAEDCDPRTAAELAVYVAAADRLRAGSLNELKVRGIVYRIARTRRMLRWGPDGPESPRPSDPRGEAPCPIHVPLDEDGNYLPEDDEDDAEDV